MFFFRWVKVFFCVEFYSYLFLFDNKLCRGWVFLDRFFMNFCWWLIILRNFCSFEIFFGCFIFLIVVVLFVFGLIFWVLRLWLVNFNWCLENLYFFGFKVIFVLVSFVKMLFNFLLCFVCVLLCIKMLFMI